MPKQKRRVAEVHENRAVVTTLGVVAPSGRADDPPTSRSCRSRGIETIANITDAINEQVKKGRNRPLDEVYPIVYMIRLRIRDGGAVRIKACHLAVGVDVEGRKRVLGM